MLKSWTCHLHKMERGCKALFAPAWILLAWVCSPSWCSVGWTRGGSCPPQPELSMRADRLQEMGETMRFCFAGATAWEWWRGNASMTRAGWARGQRARFSCCEAFLVSALLLHNKAQHGAMLGRRVTAPLCGGSQEGSQFENWGRLQEKKKKKALGVVPEKAQAVSVRGGTAASLCKSDLGQTVPEVSSSRGKEALLKHCCRSAAAFSTHLKIWLLVKHFRRTKLFRNSSNQLQAPSSFISALTEPLTSSLCSGWYYEGEIVDVYEVLWR